MTEKVKIHLQHIQKVERVTVFRGAQIDFLSFDQQGSEVTVQVPSDLLDERPTIDADVIGVAPDGESAKAVREIYRIRRPPISADPIDTPPLGVTFEIVKRNLLTDESVKGFGHFLLSMYTEGLESSAKEAGCPTEFESLIINTEGRVLIGVMSFRRVEKVEET